MAMYHAIRDTQYAIRAPNYLSAYKAPSTFVENSLQIDLFMQNKPNLKDAQMNISFYSTMDYENIGDWTLGENKPNQTQFARCPNGRKFNVNKGL